MRVEPKKIDRYLYEWETKSGQDRAESMRSRLADYDTDARKADRLAQCECLVCFYLCRPRMAGQALTKRDCGLCGQEILHHNTDIGVICKECSLERGLCAHCGGDLNGKVRRKVDLEYRERSAG